MVSATAVSFLVTTSILTIWYGQLNYATLSAFQ